MKSSSAKAKGRRAAAEIREIMLQTFPELSGDDVRVTPSGVQGEDLQLSPRAREVLPFSFEMKNRERLNIWETMEQARRHSEKSGYRPVAVFRRNRAPFHVCMELDSFLWLLGG